MNLAKAWSLAVKSTQSLLIYARKGVKKIKGKKKKECLEKIVNLENRLNQGDDLAQTTLRETRASLQKIEDKKLEDNALFFKGVVG